jgi:hypothetical protein
MARLRDLERDAYSWLNNAARRSAKEIMNGLADAGPEWSGEFKDSWVAFAPGSGVGSGSYPYKLSDIPKLPATKREATRKTKFVIQNIAPHAAIAMDLVDVPREEFRFPGQGPQGEIVARGTRPDNGKRGEVSSGGGDARSTAPLNWYPLYVQGGKMQKALERGVRLAKPE